MQQMTWREALDEAETVEEMNEIAVMSQKKMDEQLSKVEQFLDVDRNFAAAAQQGRGLMFTERFASEVDARIELLGQ